MFTGIVTTLGEVVRAKTAKGRLDLEVKAPGIARELSKGDSVAVNGVCLTAIATGRRHFSVQVVDETLALTTLGRMRKGDPVNLELPLRLSDRIGGHMVQGHVDGIARAVRVEPGDGATRVWFEAPEEVLRYLAFKGSVAVDGVSLTVAGVGATGFEVVVIPHSLRSTNLAATRVGSEVNVEVDLIAKYIERLMEGAR